MSRRVRCEAIGQHWSASAVATAQTPNPKMASVSKAGDVQSKDLSGHSLGSGSVSVLNVAVAAH